MAPRAITAWAADQVDCQNIKIHAQPRRRCGARTPPGQRGHGGQPDAQFFLY